MLFNDIEILSTDEALNVSEKTRSLTFDYH